MTDGGVLSGEVRLLMLGDFFPEYLPTKGADVDIRKKVNGPIMKPAVTSKERRLSAGLFTADSFLFILAECFAESFDQELNKIWIGVILKRCCSGWNNNGHMNGCSPTFCDVGL